MLNGKLEAFFTGARECRAQGPSSQERFKQNSVQSTRVDRQLQKGSSSTTPGRSFGGVSVFVYPSSTKAQRDSMLTRLADEKAYRRLAISKDTNWADIALP